MKRGVVVVQEWRVQVESRRREEPRHLQPPLDWLRFITNHRVLPEERLSCEAPGPTDERGRLESRVVTLVVVHYSAGRCLVVGEGEEAGESFFGEGGGHPERREQELRRDSGVSASATWLSCKRRRGEGAVTESTYLVESI